MLCWGGGGERKKEEKRENVGRNGVGACLTTCKEKDITLVILCEKICINNNRIQKLSGRQG